MHTITQQQEAIVHSDAHNLVVNAFAGTGKTSTLVEYAKERKDKRILYLAFNKAIKEEAIKKFPSNVRCVTTHGLAFPQFGSKYVKKIDNLKATHVAKSLHVDLVTAGFIVKVINNFLASADKEILPFHTNSCAPGLGLKQLEALLKLAKASWELMQKTDVRDMPMPHDGYLKLYELSKPKINTDIILFDEAQDANPATLSIVAQQKHAAKVFVGDRYQAIYGFRGATDALEAVKADEKLLLSASFRFGSGVANVASALLEEWRGCEHAIVGKGKHNTVFSVNTTMPHAVISRTNGCLFKEAAQLAQANIPFSFNGGVEGYKFEQILDVYYLSQDRREFMRDPFLASFESQEQLEHYAGALDDKEVKSLLRVVGEYSSSVPTLVSRIKKLGANQCADAKVTLSTAHKAKGLEFLDVVLTDDYASLEEKMDDKTGLKARPAAEEINITYVAVTRAMRGIKLPENLRDWLVNSEHSYVLRNEPRPAPVQQTKPAPASLATLPATSKRPGRPRKAATKVAAADFAFA